MGQSPRDDKSEPPLELPSLPLLGRRKKPRRSRRPADAVAIETPHAGPPEPEAVETPRIAPSDPDAAQDPASGRRAVHVPRDGARLGEPPIAQGLSPSYDETTRPFTAPTRTVPEPRLDEEPVLGEPLPDGGAVDTSTEEPTADRRDEQAPGRRLVKSRTKKARTKKARTKADQVEKDRPQKVREPRSTPLVPGRVAAVLTGLLVGAGGAAGTYGAMTGCKVLRGVSSCGGAPGFFILVALLVLMVLLGTGLLKLFKVGDPGSTSFLAVGIVAVISMLALLSVIFSVWMFVVIPLLSALAFLLAHWVTTRFADEDKGRRDWT